MNSINNEHFSIEWSSEKEKKDFKRINDEWTIIISDKSFLLPFVFFPLFFSVLFLFLSPSHSHSYSHSLSRSWWWWRRRRRVKLDTYSFLNNSLADQREKKIDLFCFSCSRFHPSFLLLFSFLSLLCYIHNYDQCLLYPRTNHNHGS